MGLARLLDLPWEITNPSLFQELLLNRLAVLSPVRAHIAKWTEKLIAGVYQVPSRGSGMCDRNDEWRAYVETLFEQNRITKNGWTIEQCLDAVDLRPVLSFLTPILKPDAQY